MSQQNSHLDQVKKYPNFALRNSFIVFFLAIIIFGLIIFFFLSFLAEKAPDKTAESKIPLLRPMATPTLPPIPSSKILSNGNYHIFQTFNNCGPASLSMALRFYGIEVSQAELGNDLRPYQIPGGDNDDKSVTLEELAEKAKEYGFITYHRPMGNPEIIKKFIANDIPVIARTWTKPNEDIGHYRVIKGYDEARGIFVQDDSLQNKNLEYTYSDFNEIWEKFNYEYLVLVPKEKEEIANTILGNHLDTKNAWRDAIKNSEEELRTNPNALSARFNLSVALYNVGEYKRSTEEFEKAEHLLPFRTLWYQIEPIEAYYELRNYDRVFEVTNKVLNNYNRAFSELYILRGKAYQRQGQTDLARAEFEKAVFYNVNLKDARELLNST